MKIDSLTKKIGIIATIIFTIFYFSLKYFNEKDTDLLGKWASKETDGKDYIFNFYKKDSLKINNKEGDSNSYKYQMKDNFLILYEDGSMIFKWEIEKTKEKLILRDNESLFILFKVIDE